MHKECKPRIPENPQWVSVLFGFPRKEIQQVRVRLSNGALATATYNNREKKWTDKATGETLTNVTYWRLLTTSLLPEEIPLEHDR